MRWPVKKLGEVLSFEYGSGLPEKNRISGNIPVFGSNGKIGVHNKKLVEGPGIIIGRKGSIGEIIWSDRDFWPIDTTYFAKLNNNENLKFIYYLLSTLNLKRLNKASGVPGLNRNDVYSLSVSLPAISYQKKIVERLDAIRKAQEFCDQQIHKTGELFESILEIEITANNISMQTLSFFTDRITYGFTSPMPTSIEGPYMITAKDIMEGEINYKSCRKTTINAFNKLITDKCRPDLEDILLTKDGALGRIALVTKVPLCINQSVALIKPDKAKIVPQFLKFLLESSKYQRIMLAGAGGTTIKHIYITIIDKMKVAVPNLKEQRKIVKKLEAVQDYKKLLQKQKILLKELFDSVLDKSMKGEIDN